VFPVRYEVDFYISQKTALFIVTAVKTSNLVGYKTQFVPHRRHITAVLQSPAGYAVLRFEASTAVNMKSVFLDIRTQFVPHRRHITSPLHSPAG
jgi:hypothetical protein